MRVTLAALGSGTVGTLTGQVKEALLRAQCILGAERLLRGLPTECTQNRIAAVTADGLIQALQQEHAENCVESILDHTLLLSEAQFIDPFSALSLKSEPKVS